MTGPDAAHVKVAVCVVSRNRPGLLSQLLDSWHKLDPAPPGVQLHFIVVENHLERTPEYAQAVDNFRDRLGGAGRACLDHGAKTAAADVTVIERATPQRLSVRSTFHWERQHRIQQNRMRGKSRAKAGFEILLHALLCLPHLVRGPLGRGASLARVVRRAGGIAGNVQYLSSIGRWAGIEMALRSCVACG